MARLAVSWLDVSLIVVFGAVCVGVVSYLDDREDAYKAEPSLELEDVQLRSSVPRIQAELAALEQRLAALRAQAIAAEIEARRRRAEMTVLERRYPGLWLREPRTSDQSVAPGLQSAVKAFDDAAVAVEVSGALASDLSKEVDELDAGKTRTSSELRQAQRDAAAEIPRLKREREDRWWRGFRLRAVEGLAVPAGLAVAPAAWRRRWFAAGAVFLAVAVIAIGVVTYHVLPIVAGVLGIMFGLLVVAIAARSTR